MPSVYLSPSNQDGNIGADGISEEVRMNALAREVGLVLTSRGITVYYNHPNWTLEQIINDSNSKNPDLHISIHSNAGGGSGTETWCNEISGTSSAHFGSRLQAALVGALDLPDRGIKDSTVPGFRWAEVVRTSATAVLTEIFFHDNAADILRFNQRRNSVIQAMAGVIMEWFDLAEPPTIKIRAGGQVFDAVIINSRSYAQVRQLAEALGHTVTWDETNRTVIVE